MTLRELIKRIPRRTQANDWVVNFNQEQTRFYTRACCPFHVKDISCFTSFIIREMRKLGLKVKDIFKIDATFKHGKFVSPNEAIFIELIFEPVF